MCEIVFLVFLPVHVAGINLCWVAYVISAIVVKDYYICAVYLYYPRLVGSQCH
jgi:hypothetical protein